MKQPEDHNHLPSSLVNTTTSQEKIKLWSLVLWAAGISHEVDRENGEWFLKVDPEKRDEASRELAIFEEENKNWPPQPVAKTNHSDFRSGNQPPTILMMGGLMVLYTVTGPWTDGSPWFKHGAVIGSQILRHGEWWRVITGLTLHADPVHLLGNVLIGGFLIHFLCRLIGNGLGWMLILLAGGIGNYINILFHGTGHNSVGFSTSVFGTIGILTGRQCVMRQGMAKTVLPSLAAGLALLAFLGTGGEHTDLGAHLFGMVTGVCLGAFFALLPVTHKLISCKGLQSFLFIVCLIFVTFCWGLAFE